MNLALRKANKSVSRFLFELRNEEEVRCVSRNTAPIAFSDHKKWFEKKLASSVSLILIAEENGTPIAQTRFDAKGQYAEVSVAVVSAFRGKGYGTKIIADATKLFFKKYTKVFAVRAYANLGNAASVKSFSRAGYRHLGEVDDEGTTRHLLVFERLN